MKSIYNKKDETYIEDTNDLEDMMNTAIQPIFDEYVKLGYPIRQISHVMLSTVFECELMHMFNRKV
jgi:hypothetical protein